jgi:hypothetical protein
MSARFNLAMALRLRRHVDDIELGELVNAYRAQVLREAADMVDAAGDRCQCDTCRVSRDHAASLRHEAELTEGPLPTRRGEAA